MDADERQQIATVESLTAPQAKALELLAQGGRMGEVSEAVGVHRATLWEWTRQPAFAEALAWMRQAAWAAATDRMRYNVTRAAILIGQVLDNERAELRDRLLAARLAMITTGVFFKAEPPNTPEVEPPKEPDTWESIVRATAERVADLRGLYGIDDEPTPGRAWAAAGLSRKSFLLASKLKGDLGATRELCGAAVARVERQLDRDAFAQDEAS